MLNLLRSVVHFELQTNMFFVQSYYVSYPIFRPDDEEPTKPNLEKFRRSGSIRASVRGEVRSSIIQRSSVRSRRSVKMTTREEI